MRGALFWVAKVPALTMSTAGCPAPSQSTSVSLALLEDAAEASRPGWFSDRGIDRSVLSQQRDLPKPAVRCIAGSAWPCRLRHSTGSRPVTRDAPSDIRVTREQLTEVVRGRIAARRDRDRAIQGSRILRRLTFLTPLVRAQEIGIIPEQGCPVDLISDCYLRFRPGPPRRPLREPGRL
jgi:hypothetical protein